MFRAGRDADTSASQRHDTVREMEGTFAALGAMESAGIDVTSMGRTPTEIRILQAAAASGLYAGKLIAGNGPRKSEDR